VRSLDLAAVAATVALFLVAVDAIAIPAQPLNLGGWLDATINEWLVWFTGLYLTLIGLHALVERAAVLRERRSRRALTLDRSPSGNHHRSV
jgi:hypothetical protein